MPRKKTTKKKTRRNPSKGVKYSSYKPKKKTQKKTTNKYVTLKLPESLIKRIIRFKERFRKKSYSYT